ncbi:MAG: tetratricopeptide repeat protein, partial [Kiritimatiellaeota bacterium]|nr:tetratricopeptide repeat protein [Kiritimatiellota bacterium]
GAPPAAAPPGPRDALQAAPCRAEDPTVSEQEAALLKKAEAVAARSPAEAARLVEAAMTPESSPALWFAVGVFRLRERRPEEAAAAFRRALKKLPDFSRARLNLARALLDLGRHKAAARELARLTVVRGVDRGTVWGLLGFALLSAGNNTAAETAYRNALVFRPDSAAVRLGLIKTLLAQKRFAAARTVLREELDRTPRRVDLWTLLASADLAEGRDRDALIHLECARRVGKLKPEELATLGDLMLEHGLAADAARTFTRAAALENAPVGRLLRAADGFLLLNDADRAAALLDQVRSSQKPAPDSENGVKLRFLEGRLAEARGDEQGAREAYSAVLDHDPLHAPALFALGDLEYRAGNLDRALMLYERAGRLPDNRAKALVRQARIAVERSQYPVAERLLEQALESKSDPDVRDYLDQIRRLVRATREP